MTGITKELDVLKQLFSNLSEEDKQRFLVSVSQGSEIKKVVESKEITCCPHCKATHFVKNGKECGNQRYLFYDFI